MIDIVLSVMIGIMILCAVVRIVYNRKHRRTCCGGTCTGCLMSGTGCPEGKRSGDEE